MPKDKLEPSQWVVDVVALSGAAGNFFHEAGGVITTGIAIVSVAGVVTVCLVNSRDLPPWAQLLLGTTGAAGVVYDPKKGQTQTAIRQEFQQPVESAIAATTATNEPTPTPVSLSGYTLPPIESDLDEEGEWLTPQEIAGKH